MPVANAAASPPLDPPAVLVPSNGLRVTPCSPDSVCTRRPMSGRFVRASGIAPAARRRSTTGASVGAIAFASAGTPCVVAEPATSRFSLIVNGTPWNTPSGSPAATARSASFAACRASSASTSVTALTAGLTASIRSRCDCTTSTADTSPLAIALASSDAERRHNSSIGPPESHFGSHTRKDG